MRSAAIALTVLVAAGCAAEPIALEPDNDPEPAVNQDFPDPDVLTTDEGYLAFATNGNNRNVQVAGAESLDDEWLLLSDDALPDLPSWVIPGKTWAPEVTEVSEGNYVLYFTATNFQPSVQCIGVATSTEAEGPYVVQGDAMLVCPAEEGGAIDATTFVDDDQLYLLYKNDGNCCGLDTWIYLVPLSNDGLTLTGEPRQLIKQTLDWEGDLIEAPTLLERDGTYFLFYSSNSYGDERYAVGLATATSLDGPWTKNEEPFFSTLSSDGEYLGPGGQDIVEVGDDEYRIVFHAWDDAFTYRAMFVEEVIWTHEPEVDLEG